jgi:hypothetical protein
MSDTLHSRNELARKLMKQWSDAWTPCTVTVNEIHLLARSGDLPFQSYYELPFSNATSSSKKLANMDPQPIQRWQWTFKNNNDNNNDDNDNSNNVSDVYQDGEWLGVDSTVADVAVATRDQRLSLPLNLLTFNVLSDVLPTGHSADVRLCHDQRYICVLDVIEQANADLVCLQEVSPTFLALLVCCSLC